MHRVYVCAQHVYMDALQNTCISCMGAHACVCVCAFHACMNVHCVSRRLRASVCLNCVHIYSVCINVLCMEIVCVWAQHVYMHALCMCALCVFAYKTLFRIF